MNRCANILLLMITLTLTGCGYNDLQKGDEQVTSSWAEVLNQYQRRADLVPNLVNTVKAYAKHEKELLIEVTDARTRLHQIKLDQASPEYQEELAHYQKAQSNLSAALSRLLMVSENYPQLKADNVFRDLQAQLEGTENRITVARNRYIKAVQAYNITVRSFPSNLTAKIFDYTIKPNLFLDNEIDLSKPVAVTFGKDQ